MLILILGRMELSEQPSEPTPTGFGMERHVPKPVHEHHQRVSERIVSNEYLYVRTIRFIQFCPSLRSQLDDLNHAFNEHGVSQQQINVNIGDSVFTSGPGYVGHLCHKREKGTLCGDGQVRFHSGSAAGADKAQEVLAVLGRAESNMSSRPIRGQSVQESLPVFVRECVSDSISRLPTPFPRFGTGGFQVGRVAGELGDTLNLLLGVIHQHQV